MDLTKSKDLNLNSIYLENQYFIKNQSYEELEQKDKELE